MHHVSEEGLLENTMLWELNFIGPMAGKVGAAGQQQRIAYEENINIEIAREYNCSMLNWRVGYSRSMIIFDLKCWFLHYNCMFNFMVCVSM